MGNCCLIYNARLLDEKLDGPGAIFVIEGKIRAVFEGYFTSSETVKKMAESVLKEDGLENSIELYDAHGLTVTPAFIDMHVHMRYPGQSAKEDLSSGLHAAASGGYGTVVAMPNTNPVVSSLEEAMCIEKEAAALGLTHLFQVVSITKGFDGQTTSHLDLLDKKYVPVISEDGKDILASAVMLDGMKKAAAKGIIVSCHCEDVTLAQEARPYRQKALELMKENGISASDYSQIDLGSFEDPEQMAKVVREIDDNLSKANQLLAVAENAATSRNIKLATLAGCSIHLAHVSTAESLREIAYARGEYPNTKITCEVTPHHLALTGDVEPEIRALVNPPLRFENDRKTLINGLLYGTVDVISTDHAPHTAEDKAAGSPGFTGLETAYGVCNTILVHQEGMNSKRLSQLMSANPARILGINKGLLKTGYDADLTIVDSDEEWTVDASQFYSKGKATPFDGKTLQGRVKGLFIDGRKVFER